MVYFLSAVDPSQTRSGMEKRCNMWWHYWRQQGAVEWVRLPEQWCAGGRLNRWLLRLFPFSALPHPVQLFLFLSKSPLKQLFRHNQILNRVLTQPRPPDDIVFLLKAYNLYYLPLRKIRPLLAQSTQLLIDFDESYCLSMETFSYQLDHWSSIQPLLYERERLMLSVPNVTYYVSGENEVAKFRAYYQPQSPIRVMDNKLTINPPFHKKMLGTPLRLLLIGTYNYEPNVAMLRDFLNDLLPSLVNPHAYEFHVVGRNLPPALAEQLKKYACVTVHGGLSDDALAELYQTMHLNLTLVQLGGGTKYKIVEALAYGVPIVATAASVEGLTIEPLKHYFPTTSHMFEESLRLLTPALYEQMQLNCRLVYEQRYYIEAT